MKGITNSEVLYANGGIVTVNRKRVSLLKRVARESESHKSRLCAHRDIEERLHEMFIVLRKGAYIRPHKHQNKSESFHLVEGSVDVVLFNEEGTIREVVKMGEYNSGKVFYYRLNEPLYHTFLLNSQHIIFHETTNGPFRKENTYFAPWSPEITQRKQSLIYLRSLRTQVKHYQSLRREE